MTRDKYKDYTAEKLLQDDYFISSVIEPTDETEEFWDDVIRKGIVKMDDYVSAYYLIDAMQVKSETISDEEIGNLWNNIQKGKNQRRRRTFGWVILSGLAASIMLLITFSITLPEKEKKQLLSEQLTIDKVQKPDLVGDNIQLVLADETILLEGKNAEIIHKEEEVAINNQNKKLNRKEEKQQSITYNQLIVPKGKRSMLTFEDGSKIWVNAGSRIVYPVAFEESKREIYVDGEAFLDVAPNEQRPFIVKAANFQVEVLGTSFNIMAYENDETQHVVLVSGTVNINTSNHEKTTLSPEQIFLLENGNSKVTHVNTDDYISWKDGLYNYESARLDLIMKRLSRYYGKEIECSPSIAHLECTGKLDLKENLAKVLTGIALTAPIDFTINNEKYTIISKSKKMAYEVKPASF